MTRRTILAVCSACALGALALLGGLVSFLASAEFDVRVADYAVRVIEERTGGKASFEAFDVDLWRQTITLDDFVLRGEEDPDENALLDVARIQIGFRLRSLLQRRIDLWGLEVIAPEIWLRVGPGGETNVPAPPDPDRPGRSIPFEISIGELAVSDGSLVINESRIDVDFELSDVQGLFAFEEEVDSLTGNLDFGGTIEGIGSTPLPYRMETGFAYRGQALLLEPSRVSSGDTMLVVEGTIDEFLGARTGALTYSGSVDLPILNYFLPAVEVSGTSEVRGSLDFSTTDIATSGHLSSAGLSVGEWTAGDLAADFDYRFPGGTLIATNIHTRFAGGEVAGTVTIDPLPGAPQFRVSLDYRGVEPAAFGSWFPEGVSFVRSSRARGRIEGWFRPAFDEFELDGSLALSAGAGGGIGPQLAGVTGSTDFHTTPGLVELSGLSAAYRDTRVEADGRISADRLALDVAVESADLRDLAFLYSGATGRGRFVGSVSGTREMPVLDGDFAMELPDTRLDATGRVSSEELALEVRMDSDDLRDLAFLYDGASGGGRYEGTLAGTPDLPSFDGEFLLRGLEYRDWTIDRVEGEVAGTTREVQLGDVIVAHRSSELRLNGVYRFDGDPSNLDIEVLRLEAGDLEPLAERAIGGSATGRIRLTSLDPIRANGLLDFGELSYEGNRVGEGHAAIIYDPGLVEVSDLVIARDGSRVSGSMRYAPVSEELALDLSLADYPLHDLKWLGVPESLDGLVDRADLSVTGTRTAPEVEGQAVVRDFRFGQQSFDSANIDVRTSSGRVHTVVRIDDRLEMEVDVDTLQDGYPLRGRATFVDFDAGLLAGLEDGSLIAGGEVTFEGPLLDLEALAGEGSVRSLAASIGAHALEVSRPFTFRFDSRRVTVSPLLLVGEGETSIELEGTIALEADAPLDLNVYGSVDLAALDQHYENLLLSGRLILDATVEGTATDPELGGIVTLADVSVSHPELFLGLTGLNGDVFLDGPRATLIGVRGLMGGGSVNLSGTVSVGGETQGAMEIRANASNVRVRTLTGLRTVFDGAFGLGGTLDMPTLDGRVQLLSLSFDESFDEFLSLFDSGPGTASGGGPLDEMALAVHVEGDRNIRVQNELASLESRLDLDIGGTLGSPSLTGHAEISRGTLTLQGRRYRVTRGNVDFVDPVGIDPRIDIQAEADVRDYRIILLITGQGEDVQLTMRSEPALPQLEIVSLIAGGRTREELADETPQAGLVSDEQLFQGAASTILADMLQSRVGSRLGILNSVRIDPFLVGAENDPVARLTISEQITSDLEITYSQDLSSNSQQIIQIEYFLNGDTSFIASRDEVGRLGLDIKLRKRFD